MARVVLARDRGLRRDARWRCSSLTLAGFGALPVIVALLFVANAFLGLVIPTTMVMALDPHPDIAGLASSLGGTLQMLAGGLMITLAGPFFDGTPAADGRDDRALRGDRARGGGRDAARAVRRRAACALTAMLPVEKLDQIQGALRVRRGAAERRRRRRGELAALSREYAELKPVVEQIAALARAAARARRGRAPAGRSRDARRWPRRSSRRIKAALPEVGAGGAPRAAAARRRRRALGHPRDPRRHRRRRGRAVRRRPRADVPAARRGARLALGRGRGGRRPSSAATRS